MRATPRTTPKHNQPRVHSSKQAACFHASRNPRRSFSTARNEDGQLQITQVSVPSNIIDLGLGQPSASLLPINAFDNAMHTLALHKSGWKWLQYGQQQGSAAFREELANFLNNSNYFYPPTSTTTATPTPASKTKTVNSDDLFVTAGASAALHLSCSLLLKRGSEADTETPVILAENPTYFLSLGIFKDAGAKLVAMPPDPEDHNNLTYLNNNSSNNNSNNNNSPILDTYYQQLEALIQQHRPKLMYVIPTYQNPTGRTMTAARRQQLVRLAQK